MGWTLTGAKFRYKEEETMAEADGNNVAWVCPRCHRPLLFVYLDGRKGSSRRKPTQCKGCGWSFFLSPEFSATKSTELRSEVMTIERKSTHQKRVARK